MQQTIKGTNLAQTIAAPLPAKPRRSKRARAETRAFYLFISPWADWLPHPLADSAAAGAGDLV